MKATKIMLLRHGEKPAKDLTPFGVTQFGERDKESLAVRGWQRAGALMGLFASLGTQTKHPFLAKPQFLYASKPLRRKGSRRPLQTITPLSEKLSIPINSRFPRFEIESMVEDVFSCKGVVLICWQREYIPMIALQILGRTKTAPTVWPENRFDMFWVFDLDNRSGKYKFRQVPQKLLRGDLTSLIK
jgi:hypothetical protein